ncbi:MAG: sigma-70 family RNA polymerase sigma factor [Bacteroidales bacterium]|nr:sigma-70 family RNA polymerase sigma factor [Bacteroidales bacterium]MCF8350352.1 sigma-70 family RNA polymerase sigma factor [Bacteroidales bacterium]MCF8376484.1 sigma-70 family RNA polymerase sigma factor [Bacteroidales bacterium]MCF8401486.1 sigma-70 family RNA polymerase sigma factor [Bacteroidales bacterium]
MSSDRDFIKRCLKNDKKAQEELYTRFAPKMFGVCLRFARSSMEAEDIMQEGFIKVFTHLKDYRNEGSFEGWIRRTIVNTAINFYRKNLKLNQEMDIADIEVPNSQEVSAIEKLSAEELLDCINELPDGYRVIFNLNVTEGYTHKEIGKLLDISENTSKSQLSRARQTLQKKLKGLIK